MLTGQHPLRIGLSVIAPGGPLAIPTDTFTLPDLELDVDEQNDVIEQPPEMAQHMRDMLQRILTADAMTAFG